MRLATLLHALSLAALVILPAAAAYQFATTDIAASLMADRPELFIAAAPGGTRLATLIALNLATLALTLAILWQVRGLFRAFMGSTDPSESVSHRLVSTGILLLAQAAWSTTAHAAETMLLTWANPPGQRTLAIALSHTELALVIAGGLLICTGRALHQGALALRENRDFI